MERRKALEYTCCKEFKWDEISLDTRKQYTQLRNQPIELSAYSFMLQKLEYIHNNPVLVGFVELPEHWNY